MFQKLPSHIAVYVSSFVVVTVLNIFTLSLFARILGPEKYGIFGYLQGIFLFISAVISQGFIQSNIRFRSTYKENGRYPEFIIYYQSTMIVVVLLTVGFLTMIIPGIQDVSPKIGMHKTAVILLVVSSSLFLMLLSLFQANLQPRKSALYSIGRAILRLAVPSLVLLTVNDKMDYFFYAVAASELIIVAIILAELNISIRNHILKISTKDYVEFLKTFWSYGFPFVGWFLCSQLIIYSDRIILERHFSDYVVGTYVSNNALAVFIISAVASPLMTAINPLIMSEVSSDRIMTPPVENAVTSAVRIYLLLAGPLALFSYLFRTDLSLLVFGEKYAGASEVFGPILTGVIFWNLAMYVHKPLEIAQKTGKMFIALLMASALSITANIFLIPDYSYMGAAYATMIGYVTYGILITLLLKDSFVKIFPWKTGVRFIVMMFIILALDYAVRASITIFSIPGKIAVGIGSCCMMYGILFLLREFSIDEIKSVLKKVQSLTKTI